MFAHKLLTIVSVLREMKLQKHYPSSFFRWFKTIYYWWLPCPRPKTHFHSDDFFSFLFFCFHSPEYFCNIDIHKNIRTCDNSCSRALVCGFLFILLHIFFCIRDIYYFCMNVCEYIFITLNKLSNIYEILRTKTRKSDESFISILSKFTQHLSWSWLIPYFFFISFFFLSR